MNVGINSLSLKKNTNAQVFRVVYGILSFVVVFLLFMSYTGGMWLSDELCVGIMMVSTITTIAYCAKKAEYRFFLLCFNATYFLFLGSGVLSAMLDSGYLGGYLDVSPRSVSHTCHVLAFSLHIVNSLYVVLDSSGAMDSLAEKPLLRRKKGFKPLQKGTIQVIWIFFLISLAADLVASIMQYRFLDTNTYVDSYIIGYNKPTYISLPESLFSFSLCLWLATNPPKKLFTPFFIVVLISQGFLLMSGARSGAMIVLLQLFYYIYYRSRTDKDFFRITKGSIIVFLVLLPFLILLLQVVKYTRVHESVKIGPQLFYEFFEDQGISAKSVARGYAYQDAIRNIGGSSYTFGALRNYLSQNLVSRLLFGIETIGKNTIEMARSGYSFGSTLSYICIRESYLSGIGSGSSYVAELFHDGGIWLLALGSAGISLLLLYLSKKTRTAKGIFKQAFLLLFFKNLLALPRSNSISWLTSTFSVQNLMLLAVLLIVNQLFSLRATQKEAAQ
ncbi:MAG: O-antigen polysaccharide polymerase Wzy [Clostridia bacterium]|nr:O-antigen polysaccharide polymerase Wzy [Clostridia bacterium]